MKKFLIFPLILTMAFTLVACGEKTDTPLDNAGNSSINSEVPPKETSTPVKNNNTVDLTTVEGWLSHWELTEEDLRPVNFTRLDKTSYSLEDGVIKEVGAYVDKALTDEETRAWIEKIISKLNSLSDEGKIMNTTKNGEELTVDYIMGRDMHIAGGSFTYKGKRVSVVISAMPRALDDADPDEAMPACSLGLRY